VGTAVDLRSLIFGRANSQHQGEGTADVKRGQLPYNRVVVTLDNSRTIRTPDEDTGGGRPVAGQSRRLSSASISCHGCVRIPIDHAQRLVLAMMSLVEIVNPASGRHGGTKAWENVRAIVFPSVSFDEL
jgi:hypothetical protein